MKYIGRTASAVLLSLDTAFAFAPNLFLRTTDHPSSLFMSKNNHRARLEKNLEELMDRDWREFRAKLVAQEAIEQKEYDDRSRANPEMYEKQSRQEKFGNIFAAIFSNKNSNSGSIFDGNSIGGATSESMLPECEDPFVSHAEIPVLMQSKVIIDKHRWAHPITHIEPGCVLVANEKLGGVFHQTVILIIEHNDAIGSKGLVINRPFSNNLNHIASATKSNVDLSLKLAFNSSPVTYGGPVMQEEYSILHGYGEVEGSKKVAPGVFVGGSEELMKEVRKSNFDAKQVLFVKGHAAWVAGQLAREISKGVWYPASVSKDFMLRYAGAPLSPQDNSLDLWADILTCLGGKYAEISAKHSGKGDMRMMP